MLASAKQRLMRSTLVGRHGTSECSRPPGLGKLINCLRRRRRSGRAPTAPAAPAAPAPPSHRKPNNRTTEQPNRPSPPSPARVEHAYSGRKRPPMHPTRLRCCCSTCSQFCALYLTCAAAAAPHQRGPLRHLRAARRCQLRPHLHTRLSFASLHRTSTRPCMW